MTGLNQFEQSELFFAFPKISLGISMWYNSEKWDAEDNSDQGFLCYKKSQEMLF